MDRALRPGNRHAGLAVMSRTALLQRGETPPSSPSSPPPSGTSSELPLDHHACIKSTLRHYHAQSGLAMPFEQAMQNNLISRCLQNAVHAAGRRGRR